MKRAIIIHAWDSSPDAHWYREEEKALKKLGHEVFVPEMPGGNWPKLPEWLSVIEDLRPDEDTVLIGHSLGAPAILRYLQTAPVKVGKVFLVAAFAKDLGIKETRNFMEAPFDFKKIKAYADAFIVINEANDPYVPIKRGKEIAEAVGGEFIEVAGNIHFDKMDLDLINSRL
jgi:predicted alpha/beta hydrolase family esterase